MEVVIGGYGIYHYTTQINTVFRARWLASSELNRKYHLPSRSGRDKVSFATIFRYIERSKLGFRICVVCTKTIIFLNFDE